MVTALWGKCNGTDIVFNRIEEGRWSIAVPASPTRRYVIELWAEDLAGNVGYYATIEAFYDSSSLDMRFRVVDIGPMFHKLDVRSVFRTIEVDPKFVTETAEIDFEVNDKPSEEWRG